MLVTATMQPWDSRIAVNSTFFKKLPSASRMSSLHFLVIELTKLSRYFNGGGVSSLRWSKNTWW